MREVVAELKRVRDRMREPVRRFPRLVQLTFARSIEQFPALSPDRRQLVFTREIGRVRKLILAEPAESSERQLTRGDFDDIQPAWSPDARSLLFVRAVDGGTHFDTADVFGRYVGGNIWHVDVESGRESRLIDEAFNPAWSPDGTRIAFDASWSGPRRIWIADARGRNAQQVTTDDSEATSHVRPRWSPDQTKIVFQSIEGTKSDVRIVGLGARTASSLRSSSRTPSCGACLSIRTPARPPDDRNRSWPARARARAARGHPTASASHSARIAAAR
jgi:TolB protein